jgi:signal transduction histidine kinase
MPRSKNASRREPARPVRAASSDESAIRNYPRLMQRYRRLMEINRVLSSTLDLPALLRRIIEAARELTETEAASILLVDPLTGELRFEASTQENMDSQLRNLVVPMQGSIAGWVASNGQPLLIPDVAADPRRFRPVDHGNSFVTRSVLAVPLTTRDKTIGVLEAINKAGEAGFIADDADTLETLAAQAAIAIETARLFQQSDLVAEMVHELRTPLASLSATSYILLKPDLPSAQHDELVHTLQAETARLTTLTSEFLDLARLETGRARFAREAFAMPELAAECLTVVRPQADERNLQCTLDLPPDAGQWPAAVGDRAKIKQVLLNLLTNAIKYNRTGGLIAVRGRLETAGFVMDVADTGYGIAAESRPHLFEKFYRVADTEGSTYGAGLGLAIAKRIVESHGGQIGIESASGSGTTIRFTLPLAS